MLFRSYSCQQGEEEREANLQEVHLRANEAKVLEFILKGDEGMEEGKYNLKIKINKDHQKTDHELTKSIYFTAPQEKTEPLTVASSSHGSEEEVDTSPSLLIAKEKVGEESTGMVVYESNAEKAKKSIPEFLILSFALVLVIVIWKK